MARSHPPRRSSRSPPATLREAHLAIAPGRRGSSLPSAEAPIRSRSSTSSRGSAPTATSRSSRTASTTASARPPPRSSTSPPSFARSLDVPFDRTRVSLAPGGNLQARARDRPATARSRAAAAREPGPPCIATAHHRDDRAETVLLRLLRGAGPRGLAVLPPRAGDLVRPLLRAPRATIDAHIGRHHVPFATDPSNRDPRFLRSRVRQELLPLLRELSPGIDEHLCALMT